MSSIIENETALFIDAASDRLKYDAAAKKLVSVKAILAYILKSSLDEFADIPVEQIAAKYIKGNPKVGNVAVHQDHPDKSLEMDGDARISGQLTEDVSVNEGRVYFDIRFEAWLPKTTGLVDVIVNIEVQNKDTPTYPIPKRGIYYGARLISAQRGTIFKNQEYDKIKKVVSIWVCENTDYSRSGTINEYVFTEKCRLGSFHEEQDTYDLMKIVVMRLGPKGENSGDDAIRLLSKLFTPNRTAEEKKKVLTEEFGISMTREVEQEVEEMCNLSMGVLERGYQQGMAQGMVEGMAQGMAKGMVEGKAQGMAEGKAQGMAEGKLDTILKYLNRGMLTLEQAISDAVEEGIPAEEAEALFSKGN